MTASYSNPGSVVYLQRKIENQAKKLCELQALVSSLKERCSNYTESAQRRNTTLYLVSEEKRFLKERIEHIHGKKAYLDLINHVDNPNLKEAEAYRLKYFNKEVI